MSSRFFARTDLGQLLIRAIHNVACYKWSLVALCKPKLPEDLSSPLPIPPIFCGVHVTRSLVLCVCFVDRCLSFFILAIVFSVLLRFTDSDSLFGIIKLFLSDLSPLSPRFLVSR